MIKEKDLPEGWKIVKLKDVADSIKTGGTPRRNIKEYWENGNIPWLKISDLDSSSPYISNSEEKITERGLENSSAKLFPEGTVLFSIFATIGATGILATPSATNQAIAGIIPKNDIIDTRYLYCCLNAERQKIASKKTHATQDNINLSILKNHKIPLPPLPTQKKIVSILDKAEKLKELRKEADKLTDDYLKSVFLEMFGDPIKNTKGWKVQKISELTSFVSYGFTRPVPHVNKGIPIITSKNVSAGMIDFDDVDYTDKKSFNDLSKKDCPIKGDILYTKDGRIGEAALVEVDDKFCISQAVAILRPLKNKINPVFFENLLNTKEFRDIVNKMAYGVALKHVSITKLKQVRIISPPIKLQNKFAEIVKQVERMRGYQKQSGQQIEDLFNALMQKAFRGELVC